LCHLGRGKTPGYKI